MKSYTHESGSFSGKGGVEIFFQKWIVAKPKGALIVVHGIGEHSGRYENLINALADKDISVFAIDHRGHGKSEGKRGHVDSFMDYVYDLKLFIEFIKDEYKGLPVILYGHSMGGVIAGKYALIYPGDFSMLVLSSPGLTSDDGVPEWKKSVGKFFASRVPALTMPNGLPIEQLSHDSDVVTQYKNDPLNHNRVSAKLFVEFTNAGRDCMVGAEVLNMPLLVFHGKGDTITDYRASEEFFNSAGSKDKDLFLYEDLYHETINETSEKREKVLGDVVGWIMNRVASSKKATTKKSTSKKVASKKATTKKSTAKKAAPKKAAAKKTAKKTETAKKTLAKKSTVSKNASSKSTESKTTTKKSSTSVKKDKTNKTPK